MADGFTPVKGKCTWWRESPVEEDIWDTRLRDDERRVRCSCFVEGDVWTFMKTEVPEDCPQWRHCRYHIRHT